MPRKLPFVALIHTRESFLYVDDMAAARVLLINLDCTIYQADTSSICRHINAGSRCNAYIAAMAKAICQTVSYQVEINFDTTKPYGVPRKWIDSTRLNVFNWNAQVDYKKELAIGYQDFAKSSL